MCLIYIYIYIYISIYIYPSEHYGLSFLDLTDAIFFTRSPFLYTFPLIMQSSIGLYYLHFNFKWLIVNLTAIAFLKLIFYLPVGRPAAEDSVQSCWLAFYSPLLQCSVSLPDRRTSPAASVSMDSLSLLL